MDKILHLLVVDQLLHVSRNFIWFHALVFALVYTYIIYICLMCQQKIWIMSKSLRQDVVPDSQKSSPKMLDQTQPN